MIFDRLENTKDYFGINPGIDRALRFIKEEAETLEVGEVRDLSDGVSARCFVYQSTPFSEGLTEAHRKYIDVMLLKEACEKIGYKPACDMENITQEYSEDNDAVLAKDHNITLLPFYEGMFAVFFPQDAHMGGVTDGEAGTVKRIVIKVPV